MERLNWKQRFEEAASKWSFAEPPQKDVFCEHCGDTRWVKLANGVARCEHCKAHRPEWAETPTVPLEFKAARLANYRTITDGSGNEIAIRVAKAWLASMTTDLYIFGTVGSGKTRLACSLLNEVYRKTGAGVFVRVDSFLKGQQPSNADVAREQLWEQFAMAPLLVIDDVGRERAEATDFTRAKLLQLYDDRIAAGGVTIWTSNLSLWNLKEQMGEERLTSRIGGKARVSELSVPDQRLRR